MKFLKRLASVAVAVVMTISTAVGAFAQDGLLTGSEYREYNASVKTVATPKANYASGDYDKTLNVKLTCSTSGARIFYTTDGTDPTYYSDIYSDPIRIKADDGQVTIRAFAVKTGWEDSEIAEFTYYVEEPEVLAVTYMEIYREPSRRTYSKGETLNLTGGKISVTYEDGTYKNIDMTQSMVSGFNSNTAGEKIITVTYEGFTDTFKVTVKEGYDFDNTDAGSENEPPAGGSTSTEEQPEEKEDERPQISGSTAKGWSAIEEELAARKAKSTVTIMLNGAVTVPDGVIRAAAKNDLILSFYIDETFKWKLNTANIDKETIIPYMGLGIRTSAMYIPSLPLLSGRGVEMARFHINSDNKLNADIVKNFGTGNKGKYACLYRYDSEANVLVALDNVKISSSGEVWLTPDISGDYLIYIDDETNMRGDLDSNLLVNAMDAAVFMNALIYGTIPDDDKWDVNGDGAVNALDAAQILKLSVQ